MVTKKMGPRKGCIMWELIAPWGNSDTSQKERPRADSKHGYQDENDVDEEEERIWRVVQFLLPEIIVIAAAPVVWMK